MPEPCVKKTEKNPGIEKCKKRPPLGRPPKSYSQGEFADGIVAYFASRRKLHLLEDFVDRGRRKSRRDTTLRSTVLDGLGPSA